MYPTFSFEKSLRVKKEFKLHWTVQIGHLLACQPLLRRSIKQVSSDETPFNSVCNIAATT